jgi:hypothetical protein
MTPANHGESAHEKLTQFFDAIYPRIAPGGHEDAIAREIQTAVADMPESDLWRAARFAIGLVEQTIAKDQYKARNAGILAARYGLGAAEPRSFSETGGQYGLTGSRAQQIVELGTSMLRHPVNMMRVVEFVTAPPPADI